MANEAVETAEDFENQVDGAEEQGEAPEQSPQSNEDDSQDFVPEVSGGAVVDSDDDDDLSNLADTDDLQASNAEPEPKPEAEEPEATADDDSAAPKEPEPKAEAEEEAEEEPEREPEPQEQVDPNAQYNSRIEQLSKYYSLSDADAESVMADPQAVMPKLAARIHAATEYTVMQMLQQQLPQMLQTIETQRTQQDAARNAFYEPFPALKTYVNQNPDAEETVKRMLVTYKQQLPKDYPVEKANREVAIAAMTALGITPEAPTGNQPQPPVSPRLVDSQVPPRGGSPHSPAQPQGAAPGKPQQINEFEALDEDFEQTGSASVY